MAKSWQIRSSLRCSESLGRNLHWPIPIKPCLSWQPDPPIVKRKTGRPQNRVWVKRSGLSPLILPHWIGPSLDQGTGKMNFPPILDLRGRENPGSFASGRRAGPEGLPGTIARCETCILTDVPRRIAPQLWSRRIMSAAFSPIMMVGALVLPEGMWGMIEASATRKPAMPWTRRRASTTLIASFPILHVPTG